MAIVEICDKEIQEYRITDSHNFCEMVEQAFE